MTVTAKVLPGHCGTNFFCGVHIGLILFKSTQHPFGPSTCMVYFGNIINNKASGVKSFWPFYVILDYNILSTVERKQLEKQTAAYFL